MITAYKRGSDLRSRAFSCRGHHHCLQQESCVYCNWITITMVPLLGQNRDADSHIDRGDSKFLFTERDPKLLLFIWCNLESTIIFHDASFCHRYVFEHLFTQKLFRLYAGVISCSAIAKLLEIPRTMPIGNSLLFIPEPGEIFGKGKRKTWFS